MDPLTKAYMSSIPLIGPTSLTPASLSLVGAGLPLLSNLTNPRTLSRRFLSPRLHCSFGLILSLDSNSHSQVFRAKQITA